MSEDAPDESLITVSEAAELLGVSVRTVERMQADGDLVPVYLPTPRRAKLRRFRQSDVEAKRTGAVA